MGVGDLLVPFVCACQLFLAWYIVFLLFLNNGLPTITFS